MKIYVITDLEGVSGVCVFEQTRDRTQALYDEARRLLVGEVNAVVQGCLDGGATEVVVLDGHGGGYNFIPEEMHPDAYFVTGVSRPRALCGLDESFDAVALLGYHAMLGTETGVLHHTQSSKNGCRYWYNGRETGEIGRRVKRDPGVTLGALSCDLDEEGNLVRGVTRHPTLEDHVVIYANATILGGETVIGHDSVIGSSVWLTHSVAPHTTVVHEGAKSQAAFDATQ